MESARNLLTVFAYGAGAWYLWFKPLVILGSPLISYLFGGLLYGIGLVAGFIVAVILFDALLDRFQWNYNDKAWVRHLAIVILELFAQVPLLAFITHSGT